MKRRPGEGTINKQGYVVYTKGSRGSCNGRQYTGAVIKLGHVLVAEKALGRPLKHPEEVHHVNENKADNRPENLVICPNRAYHMLLHQRTDAYDACGHADWLKCPILRAVRRSGKHEIQTAWEGSPRSSAVDPSSMCPRLRE